MTLAALRVTIALRSAAIAGGRQRRWIAPAFCQARRVVASALVVADGGLATERCTAAAGVGAWLVFLAAWPLGGGRVATAKMDEARP